MRIIGKKGFRFITFAVILLFGILIIPNKVGATSYQRVYDKSKIAGKYFWNDDGKIMVSETKNSDGECIQKNVNNSFITNGEIIYFIKGYQRDAINVYRINADGTKKKHIKKLKHAGSLSGFYGNKVYYERHGHYDNECDETWIHEYSYDIKTGKIKKVADSCCFRDSYKQYFIGEPNAGDYAPCPLILYNAKSGKKNIITDSNLGFYLQGNKIYFADALKEGEQYKYDNENSNWEVSIKSYHIKTKRIKIIAKKLEIHSIDEINSKKVIYSISYKDGELQYYSYNYQTGKNKKVIKD